MLRAMKVRAKRFVYAHKHLYRLFSPYLGRHVNRALRRARREGGVDGNLAVFCAYRMEAYGDGPRYISEALHALRPQTDIVWLFKDVAAARKKYPIAPYVRCLEWPKPEALSAFGRARVLVDNWRKPDFLRLGRGQDYLFAPHHDRSLKHGVLTMKDRRYRRVVEARCAAATTGSRFCRRVLRDAYHFRGPYLTDGAPRNDLLVRNDPADEARLRAALGLEAGARALLYAPTFRDLDSQLSRAQAVPLDLEHLLDVLERQTGERWVCLYRAHYLSLGLTVAPSSRRLIDVTDYPEMAELLRIADALITDYSSCAGDFALRGKPIWLYQADRDDYERHSRRLYVDMAQTPFWVAASPEALDCLIRQTTPEAARRNCRAILDFYGTCETGRAALGAARWICERLNGR